MHPAGKLAYVTDSGRHEVVTVDLDRSRIIHRTRVPGPARHVSRRCGHDPLDGARLLSGANRSARPERPPPTAPRARLRATVPRARRRLRTRRRRSCVGDVGGAERARALPDSRRRAARLRHGSTAAARRVLRLSRLRRLRPRRNRSAPRTRRCPRRRRARAARLVQRVVRLVPGVRTIGGRHAVAERGHGHRALAGRRGSLRPARDAVPHDACIALAG